MVRKLRKSLKLNNDMKMRNMQQIGPLTARGICEGIKMINCNINNNSCNNNNNNNKHIQGNRGTVGQKTLV